MRLIVIGRNPQEANIVLNSQYISNYHAEIIQLDNGDMFLVDKSMNGTFLNGIKLTPGKEVAVKRGDNIVFADIPLDWSLIEDVRIPKDVRQMKGIGSHYMNAINVQGSNVSRFHATVRQMTDGKWYICDHSKNGTTVNGVRIQKGRYVRLKKGDEIACAGVPVQNPIPDSGFPWKWVVGIAAAVVICVSAVWGIGKFSKWSPEKISHTYTSAVAWMVTEYHFEVSCPGLNLKRMGVPTEFCIEFDSDGNPHFRRYYNNSMMSQGTGFFIGNNGHLVTNRHVARPWEYMPGAMSKGLETIIDYAEAEFRSMLAEAFAAKMHYIYPHISKLEIKGVIDGTRVIPNGTYFDTSNVINCSEISCGSIEEDLAVFQMRNSWVQTNITGIPVNKICTDDVRLGNRVYTIGFPFGLTIQDYKKKPLQAYFSDGGVSNTSFDYKFGLTATSYHGASGSPVFDKKGNLVGVLNSGVDVSQGFNYAIKAKYIHKLLSQTKIIQ